MLSLKSCGKVKCCYFSQFCPIHGKIFRKEFRNSKLLYLQSKAVSIETWIEMKINMTDKYGKNSVLGYFKQEMFMTSQIVKHPSNITVYSSIDRVRLILKRANHTLHGRCFLFSRARCIH